MIHAWVLGSGGMLGSAISKKLNRQSVKVYRYSELFRWNNIEQLRIQFHTALAEFMGHLTSDDQWEIYWAAGKGSMGSNADDLQSETVALEEFLVLLKQKQMLLRLKGLFGFASSAGALYSSCSDFEITELSIVTPETDYAKVKLAQERMLINFLSEIADVKLLLARFSTLYGPGQSSGKQQGLLSHIARCSLRHQPVEIFVPLDTLRDYMFSDDAALTFIDSLRALSVDKCKHKIKIISSERSVTIAEIISTFNRLMQKRVLMVFSRTNLSIFYKPRISYRSIYPVENYSRSHSLLEGVASLLLSERRIYFDKLASTH
jgi:UDP-glucose 4-epimerase